MKIRNDSWHYRLYVFMSQWNAAWRGRDDYLDFPHTDYYNRIGLCPYMRMILIWGPLSIISNVIPVGAVFLAVIGFPLMLNGAAGVGWLVFWAVTLVAVVYAVSKIMDWRQAQHEARAGSQLYTQAPDYVEPDSFWRLVREYAVSVKTKICPVLEIEK